MPGIQVEVRIPEMIMVGVTGRAGSVTIHSHFMIRVPPAGFRDPRDPP